MEQLTDLCWGMSELEYIQVFILDHNAWIQSSVGDPTGNNNRAHQQLRRQAVSHDLALFIVTYFQQSLQVLHLQRCMSPMQPLHQKCEFKLLRQGLQNLFSVTPLILITKSILSQLTLLSQ